MTKFHQKEKIKNSEKKWFLRFSVTKSGKKRRRVNNQIHIFGFHCVAINIKND
jgi:hypothetical protein